MHPVQTLSLLHQNLKTPPISSHNRQDSVTLATKCTHCGCDCDSMSANSAYSNGFDDEFVSAIAELGFDINTFHSLSEDLKRDICESWMPRLHSSVRITQLEPLSKPFQIFKGN